MISTDPIRRWRGCGRGGALAAVALFALPGVAAAQQTAPVMPNPVWTAPFALLLLCIAILPLIPRTEHWWHENRNQLLVAAGLSVPVILYYLLRGRGIESHGHITAAGAETIGVVLRHSIVDDYIPFIVLLFSLFAISGGILITGDVPATPRTNTIILLIGGLIASIVGTTGASMLLIRPLIQTNKERKHVVHTIVFFIFAVSNVGGMLLPVGDPPLFLGYLRGVPFFWTLNLWREWAFCLAMLLALYYLVDTWFHARESKEALALDETQIEPVRIRGAWNLLPLLGVVAAVAFLVPGQALPGTNWVLPKYGFVREIVQLGLAGLSIRLTSAELHEKNAFDFYPIKEVAALFIGIFITMQVPLEILGLKGAALGLTAQAQFFWATGLLSSVLDNAPTYVVFFQIAQATHIEGMEMLALLPTAGAESAEVPLHFLRAISCGAVFFGAMTYIGNGPNFMVRSIALRYGIKMPSFFGYMVWSTVILAPIFVAVTFLFFR